MNSWDKYILEDDRFGEGMGKSAGMLQEYPIYNIFWSNPINHFIFSWRPNVSNSMVVWVGIQKVMCDGELRNVSTWHGACTRCISHFTEEELRFCICESLSGSNFNSGTRNITATMQYHCIVFWGPQVWNTAHTDITKEHHLLRWVQKVRELVTLYWQWNSGTKVRSTK